LRIVPFEVIMRAKLLMPVLAAVTLGSSGCYLGDLGNGIRYHRDFHYSFPLQTNGRVDVESFNGTVEISGWDQNTVEIDGSKWGPTPEAADALRIETDHTPDTISVRAVRPVDSRGSRGARFALKVPRGALLDRIVTTNGSIRTEDGGGPAHLRTTNGGIRVQGLRGPVEARTSNGPVELIDVNGDASLYTKNGHIHAEQLTGSVDATTSNGAIDLGLPGRLMKGVRARTSNASITIRLPEPADARVVAETSNSSIRCDFDLKVNGEFTKHRVEGVIGAGGPLIDLSTSNGSIRLLKM
jgi:hypothetical protein